MSRPFTTKAKLAFYLEKVSNVVIVDGNAAADTLPVFTDNELYFNGVEPEGHETFWINRLRRAAHGYEDADQPDGMFDFCKTARKPYDEVVTAVLWYLRSKYPDNITIDSDGSLEDWEDGIKLARSLLEELPTGEEVLADNVVNIR